MESGRNRGKKRGSIQKASLLVFFVLSLTAMAAAPFSPSGGIHRILVTRDLRGWLEPCDCKKGVLGGFPRRATVVAKEEPDLVLDAGDLVLEPSPYDLLKLRFMLQLDEKLGYFAVNVGRREAAFPLSDLTAVAKETKVPLLSANLEDNHHALVFPGHLVVTRGDTTFAVIGLVTRHANPGRGLQIVDPLPALMRELRAVRNKADFVVLLSGLTTRETERCLKKTTGVDLVLGGACPSGSRRLEKMEGVPCFLVQGKGQYVGEVVLSGKGKEIRPKSGRRIVLSPSVATDEKILDRIEDFERSLKDLDLLGEKRTKSPYVGSVACAACHGRAYRIWKRSGHARAISVLTPLKGRYDPQCLDCHTTAPGKGGYASERKTPDFAAVGCESCHGPSRAHAEAPIPGPRPRTPGDAGKCLRCHSADHSRPFHRAERMAAIRH